MTPACKHQGSCGLHIAGQRRRPHLPWFHYIPAVHQNHPKRGQMLDSHTLMPISTVFPSAAFKPTRYLMDLTEQKPWKFLPPTPHTIVRAMGTFRHLLRQVLCGRVVTLTSWSLTATVLLSPTSPQPAVRHLLAVGSLAAFRGITCTASVIPALPFSWDGSHTQNLTWHKLLCLTLHLVWH